MVQSVFAAQQDGRLVEAAPVAGNGFEVFGQNADGSADATFGTGGAVVVSPNVPPSNLEFLTVSAVAVQADGKILVAGSVTVPEELPAGGAEWDPFRNWACTTAAIQPQRLYRSP
jgi:hypothetical protein